jgi:hypothetical protein
VDCSDLLPGNYQFIAWAGMDENFYSLAPMPFVKGKTRIEDALLMLEHSGNIVSANLHHLFYSEIPATVTYEKVQRFLMPLAQLTNTIRIWTDGLPTDSDTFTFNINDNNSDYTLDGSFVNAISDKRFTYTASCIKSGSQQLHSTLRVMRLSADRRTPRLQIFNETNQVALYPFDSQSDDLIGMILKSNPKNDFDAVHIYDIILTKSNPGDANFTFEIHINGWKVINDDNTLVEE